MEGNVMYERPCDVMYHVFSHGIDEYIEDRLDAMDLADRLFDEFGCVRVYKQTEWNAQDGIFEDGDCIFSKGEYPD